MFQALREIAESLGGSGIDLATRAISGVFDLLKNLAAMLGDQLGLGRGSAGGPGGGPSMASTDRMIDRHRPAGRTGASAAAGARASGQGVRPAAGRAGAARPAARKKGPARARAAGGKTTRKRAKAPKKAGAKRDQLVRVLRHLADGNKEWMSASELSAAAGATGAPILPGNVRKVIRLRGDGLVETRPRAGSRRGSLEYRLTAQGRDRLKEADA